MWIFESPAETHVKVLTIHPRIYPLPALYMLCDELETVPPYRSRNIVFQPLELLRTVTDAFRFSWNAKFLSLLLLTLLLFLAAKSQKHFFLNYSQKILQIKKIVKFHF